MSPVETKDEVVARLALCRDQIERMGVRSLALFGSFVRNQANAHSDVDLLVQFAPGAKAFDRFMALVFLLEDRLGRSVELVTTESLSPHIGHHILDEAEDVLFAA